LGRSGEDLNFVTFVKALIRFRRGHALLRRQRHFTGEVFGDDQEKDITWLHPDGREMTVEDWRCERDHVLGIHLSGSGDEGNLLVLFNADARRTRFALPERYRGQPWRGIVDTTQETPGAAGPFVGHDLWLEPHSLRIAMHRTEDAPLFELADRLGIARHYWDIAGSRHETTAATARALLAAMGISAKSPTEVEASLTHLDRRKWEERCPPVLVLRPSEKIEIPITALGAAFDGSIAWKVIVEGGPEIGGETPGADLPIVDAEQREGQYRERRILPLRRQLPLGYHQVVFSGAVEAVVRLIIVPDRCYLPPDIGEGHKLWGLAAQLYSLRSAMNWGLGDFRDLADLCSWAGSKGAATILLNPLHALFPGHPESASPYFPSSRSFLNPLYLSPQDIPDFEESADARGRRSDPAMVAAMEALRECDWIDYSGVATVKYEILRLLYETFRRRLSRDGDARAQAFRRFVETEGAALEDFAAFEVLAERFGTPVWTEWPKEYQCPDSPSVVAFRRTRADEVAFRAYLQWQADLQLGAAAKAAKDGGMCLGLCRDLAVGCSIHGADGWRYQGVYLKGARLGAPPDPFNPSGQDWGIAPLDPHGLRERAYAPFIELLRANMRHAGALRIDHVMAIARQFWVPTGAERRSGTYIRYPLEDLLGILALESQRNRCMVIGEDLGTVPEGLRRRLAAAGILSCRVLYFEQDAGRFRRPEDYPQLATACLSTHDLPTLKGYWEGTDLEEKRALRVYPSAEVQHLNEEGRIADKAGLLAALRASRLLDEDGAGDAVGYAQLWMAVHQYLARSRCVLAFVQLDDLVDEDVQINVPGTIETERPNWRRRLHLSLEQLRSDPEIDARLTVLDRTRREVSSLA